MLGLTLGPGSQVLLAHPTNASVIASTEAYRMNALPVMGESIAVSPWRPEKKR
jgi:hypothetical protein